MGRHRQSDVHHPSSTSTDLQSASLGAAYQQDHYDGEPIAGSVPSYRQHDAYDSYDAFGPIPGRHRADGSLPGPAERGFDPEPLFASLAARYPGQVRTPDEPAEVAEQALHFSGPRFDPLPPSGVTHQPEPPAIPARNEPGAERRSESGDVRRAGGDVDVNTATPVNTAIFDRLTFEPAPFESPAFDPGPSGPAPAAEPDRVHTSIRTGRHRAEPGALGRHRGEQRSGIAHSMSGRAVFATAIATALTAGGVGAAATLPADHSDSASGSHPVQSVQARTVAESITATTPPAPAGTRIAVDVSRPTVARAFSAPKSTAATPAQRAKKADRKAKPKATRKSKPGRKAAAPTTRADAAEVANGERVAAGTTALPAAVPAARLAVTLAPTPTATPTPTPTPAAPEWVRPGTGYISSGYEPRWGTFHYGVDLAAPYGAPIYAAGDGVVLRTGPATGFGDAIYIQHANGDTTVYGHEETTLVSPGEHVHAGQLIARVGAEGQATGPHLHFEVHKGSEYGPRTDPGPWLAERGVTL